MIENYEVAALVHLEFQDDGNTLILEMTEMMGILRTLEILNRMVTL